MLYLLVQWGLSTPGRAEHSGKELKVCLINLDPRTPIQINRGERIAQLVVQKVELFDFAEADELDDTLRGDQGYGSTGID